MLKIKNTQVIFIFVPLIKSLNQYKKEDDNNQKRVDKKLEGVDKKLEGVEKKLKRIN
jgi:hypothetical protein